MEIPMTLCTIVPCATLGKGGDKAIILVLGALADDSCGYWCSGASSGPPGNYRTTADSLQCPSSCRGPEILTPEMGQGGNLFYFAIFSQHYLVKK